MEGKRGRKKSSSIKAERAKRTSGCRDLPARSKPFQRDRTMGGDEAEGAQHGKRVVAGRGGGLDSRDEKQRGLKQGVGGLKKTHNRVGRFAAAFESIQRQLQLEPHPTVMRQRCSFSFPFSPAILLSSREGSFVVYGMSQGHARTSQ